LPVCSGFVLDVKVGRRGVGKDGKEFHSVSKQGHADARRRDKGNAGIGRAARTQDKPVGISG
jgi:hypothetical protein